MRWAIIQIPSMAIDAHWKKMRWPSMGLNGVSLRLRTQYAEFKFSFLNL